MLKIHVISVTLRPYILITKINDRDQMTEKYTLLRQQSLQIQMLLNSLKPFMSENYQKI